ncbi:MAG: hypothetical protein WD894_25305 [Pirellulales bacterium]
MRYHFKRTLSTTLAVALLGCAVMLSVSAAKGPPRPAGENAFEGPPVGHPDKALISTSWIDEGTAEPFASDDQAFDWGLECGAGCPKCGFKDPHVTPVVLDMPELLGGSDEAAIDVIKRKLGINAFRGGIFDGPAAPTAQLLKHDAPAELKTFDCVLEKLTGNFAQSTCGVECLESQAAVCAAGPAGCAESCAAACKATDVAVESVSDSCTLTPVATAPEASEYNAELTLVPEPSDRVELLRHVSPGLDELANELEQADLYAEADAVRHAAQQLRLKARELKTGATAATHPRPWKPVSTTTATCDCCKNQCGSECKCSQAASSSNQRASATEILNQHR